MAEAYPKYQRILARLHFGNIGNIDIILVKKNREILLVILDSVLNHIKNVRNAPSACSGWCVYAVSAGQGLV
jgi:hypothetical protein